LGPELVDDIGQGIGHHSLERGEVGVLRAQGDGEWDGMLHDEPLLELVLNTSSLWVGLSLFSADQHRRWNAYLVQLAY